MKALVVGGTGPTGYLLVEGLLKRGYDVTILHRGTHEIREIPSEVEHIHTDPHFRETLERALAGRSFDIAIATYGRLRLVAEALWDKTPRFIAIGGNPVYRGVQLPETNFPIGLKVPTSETDPIACQEAEGPFSHKIAQTEAAVMQGHHDGKYNVTLFRYPLVYGPYQVSPPEWSVIRRILDKRPFIILPDGGLTVITRGYVGNLAHAVMLAVDQPDISAGQIYNCGDEHLLTLHQWVELIARTLNYEFDIICLPGVVAQPAQPLLPLVTTWHHGIMDLTKIKTQLGYRDVVSVHTALPQTVQWYTDRPERGAEIERNLYDPFDYDAEDQIVATYQTCLEQLAAVPFKQIDWRHPYAHPKQPGKRDHRQR